MSAKVFVDTNVWVYAKVEGSDKLKHKKAKSFFKNTQNQVFISTQVINEFYSVLSKNKIQDNTIQKSIQQILSGVSLQVITIATIKKSWDIKIKYGFSIYDSLIIASALEANCGILYTEDLQHNQVIEDQLQIVNPFSV